MSQVVAYEVQGAVAVLTINNPPVNALSAAVRQALSKGVDQALADEAVEAIVIRAAGRTFPVGADVREFGKPPQEPHLGTLCSQIEASPKPVIAAIHGTALGGGFEVALGAHYRIIDKGARIGLPEVLLGILPGAGGTQRTPRLTGAGPALELILSGKPVSAAKAHKLGLVDRVSEGDLHEQTLEYARQLINTGAGPRPTCARREGLEDAAAYLKAVKEWREKVKTNRLEAPARIVDCVEAVVMVPFETGLAMERAGFKHLVATDQARALRYAFFAERAAAKVPELSAKPRDISRVGVVGGGLMGAGIAYTCLLAGLPVVLVERNSEALEAGQGRIKALFDGGVARGRISEELATKQFGHLVFSTDMSALSQADLVIEAVFEEESVKQDVFQALDQVMRPGAILATNTSYLDIDKLAATISRPEDVIGFHFFSPAHIMRLLEVVVGARTSEDVTATGFALAKRLGKIPVRAGVCDGFIGNRVLSAYRQAADYMLEDGASPYEIDAAMREYGFALGPYQVTDMAGLQISWARRKRLAPTRDPEERYVRIGDILCEMGRFGQKTGQGFYRYEAGNRRGLEDPDVLELIATEREHKGISPRSFTPEEIQARCIDAMSNEGARLLGENIALRPSDIDVVMLHGYGFPRWRGGPMLAADMKGLLMMNNALKHRADEEDKFWRPAELLVELVRDGKHFGDLN